MTIRLQVDMDSVSDMLRSLTGRLQNLRPLMRDIGEIVVDHIKGNFRQGTAPDGTPWKPSVRALREGGRTLIDTGVLRNSFHEQPGRRSVLVGTADVRAAVHQFGARAGAFGTMDVLVREHVRRWRGKDVRVRAHTRRQRIPWGDIPARPFMPDPDHLPRILSEDIRKSILNFLWL
ncbi:phage virion morphogenesis (putative tail completion) protein [Desulfacinum hydrothermale DSM 13146]|uniref:Phage virion morphogenesis (Putative tail completion) protein n=1 Tax=Desulfacinum hydrothermale DSM 13146 TaxID=1121390 RepID=A0A1W1XX67_9BACT|nr:phage virion morphogenesis protein [Desulfacinum hydrothermale]SMC28533.1 phage virion morphogenesis (putative tail completion) protein [Desulfacinum hydrothermale DSM 13146]